MKKSRILLSGGDVYLLTIEICGPQGQGFSATLPSPRNDLNRWIAASQGEFNSQQLEKLLRSNPTLLLIALSQAVRCSGVRVRSMRQLLNRLEHCFQESGLDAAMGCINNITQPNEKSLHWNVECDARLSQFLQSKSDNAIVKSLNKFTRLFLKRATPKHSRLRKKETRRILRSMLASSFQLSKLRNSEGTWSTADKGRRCRNADVSVLALLKERFRTRQEFDQKLTAMKLAAMKQLAYGASHEINNPLANIATRAHTMLASETEPDRRFQLAVVHEQAMRAHDMISDMMLFAHPPKLNKKTTDIRLLVSSLIRDCERNLISLKQSGSSLTAFIAPDVGRVSIDATQFKVVLASLIQNAAEAIHHDHGEIEIRIRNTSQELCISVVDNGIGIDEQVKEHLFDPFYSGREAGRGLGFGLSKSWRIAKLHGGSLTHRVDADEVRTAFELRLPLDACQTVNRAA